MNPQKIERIQFIFFKITDFLDIISLQISNISLSAHLQQKKLYYSYLVTPHLIYIQSLNYTIMSFRTITQITQDNYSVFSVQQSLPQQQILLNWLKRSHPNLHLIPHFQQPLANTNYYAVQILFLKQIKKKCYVRYYCSITDHPYPTEVLLPNQSLTVYFYSDQPQLTIRCMLYEYRLQTLLSTTDFGIAVIDLHKGVSEHYDVIQDGSKVGVIGVKVYTSNSMSALSRVFMPDAVTAGNIVGLEIKNSLFVPQLQLSKEAAESKITLLDVVLTEGWVDHIEDRIKGMVGVLYHQAKYMGCKVKESRIHMYCHNGYVPISHNSILLPSKIEQQLQQCTLPFVMTVEECMLIFSIDVKVQYKIKIKEQSRTRLHCQPLCFGICPMTTLSNDQPTNINLQVGDCSNALHILQYIDAAPKKQLSKSFLCVSVFVSKPQIDTIVSNRSVLRAQPKRTELEILKEEKNTLNRLKRKLREETKKMRMNREIPLLDSIQLQSTLYQNRIRVLQKEQSQQIQQLEIYRSKLEMEMEKQRQEKGNNMEEIQGKKGEKIGGKIDASFINAIPLIKKEKKEGVRIYCVPKEAFENKCVQEAIIVKIGIEKIKIVGKKTQIKLEILNKVVLKKIYPQQQMKNMSKREKNSYLQSVDKKNGSFMQIKIQKGTVFLIGVIKNEQNIVIGKCIISLRQLIQEKNLIKDVQIYDNIRFVGQISLKLEIIPQLLQQNKPNEQQLLLIQDDQYKKLQRINKYKNRTDSASCLFQKAIKSKSKAISIQCWNTKQHFFDIEFRDTIQNGNQNELNQYTIAISPSQGMKICNNKSQDNSYLKVSKEGIFRGNGILLARILINRPQMSVPQSITYTLTIASLPTKVVSSIQQIKITLFPQINCIHLQQYVPSNKPQTLTLHMEKQQLIIQLPPMQENAFLTEQIPLEAQSTRQWPLKVHLNVYSGVEIAVEGKLWEEVAVLIDTNADQECKVVSKSTAVWFQENSKQVAVSNKNKWQRYVKCKVRCDVVGVTHHRIDLVCDGIVRNRYVVTVKVYYPSQREMYHINLEKYWNQNIMREPFAVEESITLSQMHFTHPWLVWGQLKNEAMTKEMFYLCINVQKLTQYCQVHHQDKIILGFKSQQKTKYFVFQFKFAQI